MYYNDELKQRYIDLQPRGECSNRARKMFDKACEKEAKDGKDLGEWNRNDVIWLMNQWATVDLNAVKTKILAIYAYQRWYLDNMDHDCVDKEKNVAVACNQKKITREDLDFNKAMHNSMCNDFVQLKGLMASVVDFDQGHLAPPLICFAWLDIDIEQAIRIPVDGVRWESGIILNDDGDILAQPIPDEMKDILQTYEHTSVAKNGRKTVYPCDTGYFLKPFLPDGYDAQRGPIAKNTAMAAIYRINQRLIEAGRSESDLTYANIQKSAQFQKIALQDMDGFLSTKNGHAFVESICGKNQKDFQKTRIYDILYIYEQYKKAFNLP